MKKILISDSTVDGYKNVIPNVSTKVWNKFVHDIAWNNTYCPEPVRVIYNIGTKAYPLTKIDDKTKKTVRVKDENGKVQFGEPVKILTTVVFFDDGTKVSVNNSEKDGVKFIQVHAVKNDETSPVVEVADDNSKELGFVYATVKRLMGMVDIKNNVLGDGFGRRLRDVVEGAYDTAIEEAANKHKNKLAKAEYEKKQGTAKPKRPSFAQTVLDFKEATNDLKELANVLKADLAELKSR